MHLFHKIQGEIAMDDLENKNKSVVPIFTLKKEMPIFYVTASRSDMGIGVCQQC